MFAHCIAIDSGLLLFYCCEQVIDSCASPKWAALSVGVWPEGPLAVNKEEKQQVRHFC